MSFLDLHNDVKNLQKSLFGEIEFDDDYSKIKRTPGRMNDDDDFNNAKIYKIYNVLNDILYIGIMVFVMLIRNVTIELITNFPCDREYILRCKQTEIVNKMINHTKMNKIN
jgi:hypothetical protein